MIKTSNTFSKHKKGRNKGIEYHANKITHYKYGIIAITRGIITNKHIETTRKTISKYSTKLGKILYKITLNKNITKKPLEVRMGNGKGDIIDTISQIKPGKLLLELDNINPIILTTLIKKINNKLPIRIKLIKNNENETLKKFILP